MSCNRVYHYIGKNDPNGLQTKENKKKLLHYCEVQQQTYEKGKRNSWKPNPVETVEEMVFEFFQGDTVNVNQTLVYDKNSPIRASTMWAIFYENNEPKENVANVTMEFKFNGLEYDLLCFMETCLLECDPTFFSRNRMYSNLKWTQNKDYEGSCMPKILSNFVRKSMNPPVSTAEDVFEELCQTHHIKGNKKTGYDNVTPFRQIFHLTSTLKNGRLIVPKISDAISAHRGRLKNNTVPFHTLVKLDELDHSIDHRKWVLSGIINLNYFCCLELCAERKIRKMGSEAVQKAWSSFAYFDDVKFTINGGWQIYDKSINKAAYDSLRHLVGNLEEQQSQAEEESEGEELSELTSNSSDEKEEEDSEDGDYREGRGGGEEKDDERCNSPIITISVPSISIKDKVSSKGGKVSRPKKSKKNRKTVPYSKN